METFSFPTLEGERAGASPSPGELVLRAQAEAEAIAAAAAARGREEGLAAGLVEAQAQLEPVRAALAAAVESVERSVDEHVQAAERRAVELAFALAEKILHSALGADPALVASVVAGALRRVVARDRIVLEVNPSDVELVQAALGDVQAQLGDFRRLEVVGERRVPRGGCVVSTLEGEIDARIDEQLSRAAELLRERLASA